MAADMKAVAASLRNAAHPLVGAPTDYDPLLEMIGDARFVLLGEASHGTHEFYNARAEITRRLIQEKGFTAVAVEADWPDAYRINCFVRCQSRETEAIGALDGFKRFPAWMWRNADVLDFIGWLREHNQRTHDVAQEVGFYGLDLYSLHASMEAVLDYLYSTDPEAAVRARKRYACFDHFREDTQAYGYAATFGLSSSCEDAVVQQLLDLQRNAAEYRSDGLMWGSDSNGRRSAAEDAYFHAEQNARLVMNAEEYYRSMFRGRDQSWNLRDTHMADTLDALVEHLGRHGGLPKVALWAHNSHLGDARATEMGARGELNVGQLVRERHGNEDVRLVGFSTYTGTVTAATDWGGAAERKSVRPGMAGSYEELFHEVGGDFLLNIRDESAVRQALEQRRLERAIGVIYRPETERLSHYFDATISRQFDALLHFDTTRAVEPLELSSKRDPEVPETFPSGV
jgi:erythromycin esterase-like protein